MPPVCNKDCLHCPYPDCINDKLDYEDYQALYWMEREILNPPSRKQRQRAARRRALLKANREKYAAQRRLIRDSRVASGYTRKDLATLVGVDRSTIGRWERGDTLANFAKLETVFPGITKEADQCQT